MSRDHETWSFVPDTGKISRDHHETPQGEPAFSHHQIYRKSQSVSRRKVKTSQVLPRENGPDFPGGSTLWRQIRAANNVFWSHFFLQPRDEVTVTCSHLSPSSRNRMCSSYRDVDAPTSPCTHAYSFVFINGQTNAPPFDHNLYS